MKRLLISMFVCAALLVPAAMAKADVIYDWTYDTKVVIMNYAWSSGAAGQTYSGYKRVEYDTPTGTKAVYGDSGVKWGGLSGLANSGLTLEGAQGEIVTNGASVAGVTVTHVNNTIDNRYKSLTGGTIFTAVTLKHDNFSYTVSSSLDFHFMETVNEGKGYDNDIYFMTEAEIMKSLGSFEYDGTVYYVSIYTKLQALEGEYLAMAQKELGLDSSVMLYGWTTEEGANRSTTYDLQLMVSLTPPPVPVPGAVWLMGTGLAGLVAMKRRNKK